MTFINNIIEKIKTWYKGKYIPPSKEGPFSPIVPMGRTNKYEQPLLAKTLKRVGQFWLDHWKWILIFIATIIGLFLM